MIRRPLVLLLALVAACGDGQVVPCTTENPCLVHYEWNGADAGPLVLADAGTDDAGDGGAP